MNPVRQSGAAPGPPARPIRRVWEAPVSTDGGHEKLPGDGHETARWRTRKVPGGGHEICPTRRRLPHRIPRLGPLLRCAWRCRSADRSLRRDYLKSAEEIMEILEAYDLTGSFRDAGELAGCSHHTVAVHVGARDAGRVLGAAATRRQLIDEYLPKVEEWVGQ